MVVRSKDVSTFLSPFELWSMLLSNRLAPASTCCWRSAGLHHASHLIPNLATSVDAFGVEYRLPSWQEREQQVPSSVRVRPHQEVKRTRTRSSTDAVV